MDSSTPADFDPVSATVPQIMEEFVSQRVKRWKARQENVPDRELAAVIGAMCWDNDFLPRRGPGCLLPDGRGGHAYVPYDERREGLPADLQQRIDILNRWVRNPENAPALRKLDKLLEKEVNEKCFWEFLDGGSAERVDFHGKAETTDKQIKMLAKYRLMEGGFDVSPHDKRHPHFKFGVSDVNEFGNISMNWRYLNWDCTEGEVLRCLNDYSRSSFSPENVLGRLLRDLDTIHHPEDAVMEAEKLGNELQAPKPVQNEPEWSYFLCGLDDATIPIEDITWTSLRLSPNDFKVMKRMSREQSRWPIIFRRSQLRHYQLCFRVHQLQLRQLQYCQEVEKDAALKALDQSGKPYLEGG
ncbi:hypothetical protein N658DRAFT_502927 [Parathielavia hyrcaniae]|uniref:Uncharacterized protein n=1 Tax=Parathielavia hyrcaniae TaxID=113614 RepID=A0AAN6T6W1_9PEZI|nr:hypothetical protein N658DRAFT_502927 [Parathielavia hyrcaniae]